MIPGVLIRVPVVVVTLLRCGRSVEPLSSTGLGVRLGPAPYDEFSVVQEVPGGLFGPASLSRTFLCSFRVDLLGTAEPDVLTGPTTPGKVRNQLTLVPLRSEVIPHIIDKTRQEVIPRRWV